MAVRLVIPACGETPRHQHHPPPEGAALRVSIGASKADIRRLIPNSFTPPGADGDIGEEDVYDEKPGLDFAKLVFAQLFGRAPSEHTPDDFVLRFVAFGSDDKTKTSNSAITYYDITFDHLVPDGEDNPEVLQLNTFSLAHSKFAKIALDPYAADGNVILLPRCCQTRVGSTDRERVNFMVGLMRQPRGTDNAEDV